MVATLSWGMYVGTGPTPRIYQAASLVRLTQRKNSHPTPEHATSTTFPPTQPTTLELLLTTNSVLQSLIHK